MAPNKAPFDPSVILLEDHIPHLPIFLSNPKLPPIVVPSHFGHPQNSPFLSSRFPTFLKTYHTTITAALAIMQAPEYAIMFSYLPIPYTVILTSVVSRTALTGPVSKLPTPLMQAKAEKAGRARAGLGERVVPW